MSSCSLLLHTLIPFISIFVRAVYITYRCCKRFCESDCIVVICFSFMERFCVFVLLLLNILQKKSFLLCCKTCGPHFIITSVAYIIYNNQIDYNIYNYRLYPNDYNLKSLF